MVREDPARRGLLYAGTQHGVYVSFDDGESWMPFKNGLARHAGDRSRGSRENALAIGTHGRSFYVMDDLATLRQFGAATVHDRTPSLFAPPADRFAASTARRIDYYLKAQPKTLTLEFLDAKGQVMRSFTGQPPREAGAGGAAGRRRATCRAGPVTDARR